MNFRYLILILPMLINSGYAGQAPDFLLSLKQTKENLVISAVPPKQHHFNLKAPIELRNELTQSKTKPSRAKEGEVIFTVKTPDKNTNYLATLFLCDDAKTFCEKHEVSATWSSETSKNTPPKAPTTISTSKSSQHHIKIISHPNSKTYGFILNDPKAALELAEKQNKPLFIDFFGIWCPPCNRLDDEVFSSPDFQNKSERFIKLKLDSDADVSWDLKSKYKVGGYPTIILATPHGEEIARIVGFRTKEQILAALEEAWNFRETSYPSIVKAAELGDSAALNRLARIHLDRKEYETALKYLSKNSTAEKKDLLEAQIGLLEELIENGERFSEAKYVETLQSAVEQLSDDPVSIEYRSKLSDAYAKQKKSNLQKQEVLALSKAVEEFALHPEKLKAHNNSDLTLADLWSISASGWESIGDLTQSKSNWAKAANEYKRLLGVTKSAETERGYNLEYAYCLWKSGNYPLAKTIYERLQKKYPKEFTFFFNHARMEFERNNFEKAKELGTLALEQSYGDNKLRVTLLLAQICKEQKQPKEGLMLIQNTLSTVSIPKDRSIRTHRYVKKLKEIEQSLKQIASN